VGTLVPVCGDLSLTSPAASALAARAGPLQTGDELHLVAPLPASSPQRVQSGRSSRIDIQPERSGRPLASDPPAACVPPRHWLSSRPEPLVLSWSVSKWLAAWRPQLASLPRSPAAPRPPPRAPLAGGARFPRWPKRDHEKGSTTCARASLTRAPNATHLSTVIRICITKAAGSPLAISSALAQARARQLKLWSSPNSRGAKTKSPSGRPETSSGRPVRHCEAT